MYLIQIEFTLNEIATYMASHVLPDFYENMHLETIHLDPKFMNGRGDQPLILTYTTPGRVEDFEMFPQEHAFSIIEKYHPYFEAEKAQFIKFTPLWLWTTETVTINFEPKELEFEPTGEVIRTQDAYVSLSRAQVFISFDMVQEFLSIQLASLGLMPQNPEPLQWDVSRNAIIYCAGPITFTWVISKPDAFEPILHFLNLDTALKSLGEDMRFCIEEAVPTTDEPSIGIKIPLAKKEKPYW